MEWPDSVDEIIGGDQVVGLAYVTPARGVVLLPLTNMALRDRAAGTIEPVSSSVGVWRKLEHIWRNPQVAVVYHTRLHGFSDRPEYVLVQGRASLSPVEETDWVERHLDNWERFAGPVPRGYLAERWLRAYHWRVGVSVAVERLVVWPDLACAGAPAVHGAPAVDGAPAVHGALAVEGAPAVHGAPLPPDPPPQAPPAKGTGPRIRHRRAARRAARLPHVLLGWVGEDGFPVVVPVTVAGAEAGGIVVETAAALPPGGRRAGLLAHSFARYTFGQHKRAHTGWLEPDPAAGRALYAPHTESGYRFPESRLVFRIVSGAATTLGLRQARRAGFLPARGGAR